MTNKLFHGWFKGSKLSSCWVVLFFRYFWRKSWKSNPSWLNLALVNNTVLLKSLKLCEHFAAHSSSATADQSVHISTSLGCLTCFSLELQHWSWIHFTAVAAPGWRTSTETEIIALVLLCCCWTLCWPQGSAGADAVIWKCAKKEGGGAVLKCFGGSGATVVGGKIVLPVVVVLPC